MNNFIDDSSNLIQKSNQAGFSLLEILVALALMAVVTTGGLSMMTIFSKESSRVNVNNNLQDIRQRLFRWLETPDSWTQSIQNNPALSCLPPVATGGPCNNGQTANPIIYDAVGVAQFNTATQGFDRNGAICFLAAGLTACPLRFNVTTTMSCGVAATCVSPVVVTTVTNSIGAGAFEFPINTARYSFIVYHNGGQSSTPAYSPTCTDWQTMAWGTREQCLQDGRWHRVFRNDSAGVVVEGLLTDLAAYINQAVDVKVVTAGGGSETCSASYRGGGGTGPIYCLVVARFAGEVAPYISTGSSRYGTNGQITCQTVGDPPGAGAACATADISWYIRY